MLMDCPNCKWICDAESNFCPNCRYEFHHNSRLPPPTENRVTVEYTNKTTLDKQNDLKNILIGLSTGILSGITAGTLTVFARVGFETAVIAILSYILTIGLIIWLLRELRKTQKV